MDIRRVIRCRYIFSGKNDVLTPDFSPTPDFSSRTGGLPRRSSPGPAGPLTCRCRKIGARDALPSRRRFCVFWESAG